MAYNIYVDGSFSIFNNAPTVSWAYCIYDHDMKLIAQNVYSDVSDKYAEQRQVIGELMAVSSALLKYTELAINDRCINIFYDYLGIETFITGQWKPKNIFTRTYTNELRQLIKLFKYDIKWIQVKKDNEYHKKVHNLAKGGIDKYYDEQNDKISV